MEFAPKYGITRNLGNVDFAAAEAATREALATQGFGVLTEIDVQGAMQTKLGETMDAYKILGACSPRHAWQAIGAEAPVGLLLPCNVVVARFDGDVFVSAIEPKAMFQVMERDDIEPLANEVAELLKAAINSVAVS
ncbi:MAG: DUF302 domain-containing protein [Myxococcales bacterium]|nr:DUF302 domain-containing protein [Myxococcales bacterium]